MPTNDIKTIAEGGSANVLSQAAYIALTAFLDAGFNSGIVPSNQMNKVLRQASLMSYVLAQFTVDQSGNDVLDNGSPATILANLKRAVQLTSQAAADAYTDTGSVNAYVITTAPATTSYRNNQIFAVRATHANTGATTFSAGPFTVPLVRRDGAALQSGDIVNNQVFLVAYETSLASAVMFETVASEYLDSPTFRNAPRAPTQSPLDNSTKLSTTAYADAAAAAVSVAATAQYKNANFTAGFTGNYWVDTRNGPVTCIIPNSPVGANILEFNDITATWGINYLILDPGSNTIEGQSGLFNCDVTGEESLGLWWDIVDTTWRFK